MRNGKYNCVGLAVAILFDQRAAKDAEKQNVKRAAVLTATKKQQL